MNSSVFSFFNMVMARFSLVPFNQFLYYPISACVFMLGLFASPHGLANEITTVATVPLIKISSQHYYVNMMINNQGPFKFIVDTGAHVSVISQSVADKLSLQAQDTVGFIKRGTSTKANKLNIKQLKIGEAVWHNVKMLVYPEPSFITTLNTNFKESIDGIIGLAVFEAYLLILDFPQKRLQLRQGQLNAKAKGTLRYSPLNKAPLVPIQFKEGNLAKTFRFLVDSGSNEQFILPPFVNSLPFSVQRQEKIVNSSHYGDFMAVRETLNATASLADKAITHPTVVYNKALFNSKVSHGLLGVLLMEKYKISLDQKHQLIQVE